MRIVSLALVLALASLLTVAGCDVLTKNVAVGGPKRYKVEVTKALDNIKDNILKDGEVTKDNRGDLDELLEKWRAEMSSKTSFIRMEDIKKSLDEIDADPSKQFKNQQQVVSWVSEIYGVLQTEVKD